MTTRVSWKLVAAKAGASCNEARIPSHSCYFVHSRETLPPNFPDSSIFSMLRNAQLVFPDQQDSSVNRLHQCSIQIPWPELRWNGTLKMFCFSNTSFGVFPVGLMPSETQYYTRCTAEKRNPINRSAQPLQMLRMHKFGVSQNGVGLQPYEGGHLTENFNTILPRPRRQQQLRGWKSPSPLHRTLKFKCE